MRKHLPIVLLIYASNFFFGCDDTLGINQNEKHSELSYKRMYSDKFLELQGNPLFEVINIDKVSNFSSLIEKIQALSCENKYPGITYHLNDTIYYQYGYSECSTSNVTSCFINLNSIHIKNDSLKNYRVSLDRSYSIKSLADQLKTMKHVDYFDSGGKPVLKQVLVHLNIEDHYPISKTKEVLAEIEKQFTKANLEMGENYYRYMIYFEDISFSDIPPPPPPPDLEG